MPVVHTLAKCDEAALEARTELSAGLSQNTAVGLPGCMALSLTLSVLSLV